MHSPLCIHKTPIVPRFFALYRETKFFSRVNIRAILSHSSKRFLAPPFVSLDASIPQREQFLHAKRFPNFSPFFPPPLLGHRRRHRLAPLVRPARTGTRRRTRVP